MNTITQKINKIKKEKNMNTTSITKNTTKKTPSVKSKKIVKKTRQPVSRNSLLIKTLQNATEALSQPERRPVKLNAPLMKFMYLRDKNQNLIGCIAYEVTVLSADPSGRRDLSVRVGVSTRNMSPGKTKNNTNEKKVPMERWDKKLGREIAAGRAKNALANQFESYSYQETETAVMRFALVAKNLTRRVERVINDRLDKLVNHN